MDTAAKWEYIIIQAESKGFDFFGTLSDDARWKSNIEFPYAPWVDIHANDEMVCHSFNINTILYDANSDFMSCLFSDELMKIDVIPLHSIANFQLPASEYYKWMLLKQNDYQGIIDTLYQLIGGQDEERAQLSGSTDDNPSSLTTTEAD